MTSRLGSKDNIKHIPGGGNVSNVTACGVVVVQTNTIILSIVPHERWRKQWDAFFAYEQIRAGGTLPNPFPKSFSQIQNNIITKSWWQQRFGFLTFVHNLLQICCVALSEISLKSLEISSDVIVWFSSSPGVQSLHGTLFLTWTAFSGRIRWLYLFTGPDSHQEGWLE